MCFGREIYITEKVQGAGSFPVWEKDYFQTILPEPSLLSYLYDDDFIGRDDYLGECAFNIPSKEVDVLTAPLKKEEKICGKIILDGKFSKTDIEPVPLPTDPSIDLSKTYLYKITIKKLQLNKAFMDDSDGYLEAENKKWSKKFIHEDDEHTIEL